MPISGIQQLSDQPVSADLLRHFDIDKNSDWSTVRAQYRRLVQEWHPDRYTGADATLATNRFVEINTAYRALRRHHRRYGHFGRIIDQQAASEPSHPTHSPDERSEPPSTPHKSSRQSTAGLVTPLRAACLVIALSVSVIVAMLFVMDSKLNADNRDRALYERLSSSR